MSDNKRPEDSVIIEITSGANAALYSAIREAIGKEAPVGIRATLFLMEQSGGILQVGIATRTENEGKETAEFIGSLIGGFLGVLGGGVLGSVVLGVLGSKFGGDVAEAIYDHFTDSVKIAQANPQIAIDLGIDIESAIEHARNDTPESAANIVSLEAYVQFKNEYQTWQSSNIVLNEEYTNFQESYAESVAENEVFADEYNNFQEVYTNFQDEYGKFNENYANHKEEYSEFEYEYEDFRGDFENFMEEHQELEERYADFKNKHENFVDEYRDFVEERNEFNNELDEFLDGLNDFQSVYADFENEYKNFKDNENHDTTQDYNERLDEYESMQESYMIVYSAFEDALTEYESRNEEYGSRNEVLQEQFNDYDSRNEEYESNYENSQEQYREYESRSEEYEYRLESLQEERSSYEYSSYEYESRNEEYENRLESYQEERREKENTLEDFVNTQVDWEERISQSQNQQNEWSSQERGWNDFFENNEPSEPVNHAAINLSTVELSGGESIIITSEQLLANAIDVEGDNLSIQDLVIKDNGAILINNNDNTWTINSNANLNGQIEVSYDINDGYSTTNAIAKISLSDIANNTSTIMQLEIGSDITGIIGVRNDQDWIRVSLEENTKYQINLEGSPTDGGSLIDTYIRGIYDENGNMINGTTNNDGGVNLNSRLDFATTEAETYYISAGAYGSNTGTYTLSIDTVILGSECHLT